MLTKNFLREFIVLGHEDDVIPNQTEEAWMFEKRFDLAPVVSRLLITPVEQVLATRAPSHPVEEVEQFG